MPIHNFGITDLFVWRSAQPDQQGIKDLKRLNVNAIVKLNTETPEERNWCDTVGIKLEEFPIPTFINNPTTIKTIANEIKNLTAGGIVLVHCEHGRDRTGLVIGAYHVLFDGWTPEQANAERKLYGVEGIIKMFDMDMDAILAQLYQEIHP